MNGNVIIPEVDTLTFVVLNKAERHVPHGELFDTTHSIML
jgi:hypothetical protein